MVGFEKEDEMLWMGEEDRGEVEKVRMSWWRDPLKHRMEIGGEKGGDLLMQLLSICSYQVSTC